MAGESISSLILFIAAMLVAATVAGTLVASVTDVSASIDDYSGELSEEIDTDVTVISDAGSDAVYDDGDDELTLLVKNTGERTLSTDPGVHTVLINGQYADAADVSIADPTGGEVSWQSGDVVEITVDDASENGYVSGENRVVVDVGGDREVFEFYG